MMICNFTYCIFVAFQYTFITAIQSYVCEYNAPLQESILTPQLALPQNNSNTIWKKGWMATSIICIFVQSGPSVLPPQLFSRSTTFFSFCVLSDDFQVCIKRQKDNTPTVTFMAKIENNDFSVSFVYFWLCKYFTDFPIQFFGILSYMECQE